MALDPTLIKNAMMTAMNSNQDADTATTNLANAIIATIEAATINYVSGLVAPPSGGPVTGVFVGTLS